MGRVPEVSQSGFYERLHRPESARCQHDRHLSEQVKSAFLESRETYGARRLQDTLQDQGQRVSRARIRRLMRVPYRHG